MRPGPLLPLLTSMVRLHFLLQSQDLFASCVRVCLATTAPSLSSFPRSISPRWTHFLPSLDVRVLIGHFRRCGGFFFLLLVSLAPILFRAPGGLQSWLSFSILWRVFGNRGDPPRGRPSYRQGISPSGESVLSVFLVKRNLFSDLFPDWTFVQPYATAAQPPSRPVWCCADRGCIPHHLFPASI